MANKTNKDKESDTKLIDQFRDLVSHNNENNNKYIQQIVNMIENAFQDKNEHLLDIYTKEVVHRNDVNVLKSYSDVLCKHRLSELFTLSTEILMSSESPDAVEIYMSTLLRCYSSLDSKDNVVLIENFIRDTAKNISNKAQKIQAAYMEAVIMSTVPAAIHAIVQFTKNKESAKEALGIFLYDYLKNIKVIGDQEIDRVMPDLLPMIQPVLKNCNEKYIRRFIVKIIRTSAELLDKELSTEQQVDNFLGNFKLDIFVSREEKQIEKTLCSAAIAEIVYLQSIPANSLTPSQIVGINTRKKAARIF